MNGTNKHDIASFTAGSNLAVGRVADRTDEGLKPGFKVADTEERRFTYLLGREGDLDFLDTRIYRFGFVALSSCQKSIQDFFEMVFIFTHVVVTASFLSNLL